jgi:predicted AlkP superfamily phosphohydrolase/phosphomutase
VAINEAVATDSIYNGPYLDAGPDILIGFNHGYRTSWEAALGRTSTRVFEPNDRAWSGDHCIDPALVPGVLFCNRKVEKQDPGIEDLAPTALSLFGMKPPAYMEGTPVL